MEKGTLLHFWWDKKLEQPIWKSVGWFLRKLGVILLKDPNIPLWSIYPEDALACNKEGHMLHNVHSNLIYNSQKLERTNMSLNRVISTENVVYLYNGLLVSYQKQ